MRGDIGASSAESRDMKNKLLFLKHCLTDAGNDMLKEIVLEELEKPETNWIKTIKKYLQTMNMSVNNTINLSINQIKSKIKKWDNDKWIQNMETKSTLDIYISHKKFIEEERGFRIINGIKYNIMIKARSNTFKLGWCVQNFSILEINIFRFNYQ